MATRRSRIKGIANIPQRRKLNENNEDSKHQSSITEVSCENDQIAIPNDAAKAEAESHTEDELTQDDTVSAKNTEEKSKNVVLNLQTNEIVDKISEIDNKLTEQQKIDHDLSETKNCDQQTEEKINDKNEDKELSNNAASKVDNVEKLNSYVNTTREKASDKKPNAKRRFIKAKPSIVSNRSNKSTNDINTHVDDSLNIKSENESFSEKSQTATNLSRNDYSITEYYTTSNETIRREVPNKNSSPLQQDNIKSASCMELSLKEQKEKVIAQDLSLSPIEIESECSVESNDKVNEGKIIIGNFNPPRMDNDQDEAEQEKLITEKSKKVTVKPKHKFLKPKPTIISNIRLNKPDISTVQNNVHEENGIGNSEAPQETVKMPIPMPSSNNKTFLAPKEVEVTLNETQISSGYVSDNSDYNSQDKGIKCLVPSSLSISAPESEYPAPPTSPSKINRARIKAVPRFDQRRMSCSASESEDESRRHRHRNDSVCSSASGVPENMAECMSPQRTKELNSAIQRKCRRSEQSRKLAEARREFQLKFGKETPNMSKLTMMDLIFYNPKTNPMKDSKRSKKESKTESENQTEEPAEESPETVDDPDEEVVSEDENDIPAPQIKIGPQGDIIIDEKSLVIESKKTKKDLAELEKAAVINMDNKTTYGVYKRVARPKDWDRSETLRFYKALNILGTDFSLMCELFPNRTRRELKIKFNKEERINRALVDKAMTQPSQFDFATLQHEIMIEEEEKKVREENERILQEAKKKALEESRKEKKRRRPQKTREDKLRYLIHELSESSQSEPAHEPTKSVCKADKQRKQKRPRKRKKNYLSISSVLERDSDSKDEESSDNSHSEEEYRESGDEIIVDEKPTRYGRIPKKRKAYEPTFSSSYVRNKKARTPSEDQKYEPGSIMLVTTRDSNGEPVYNVMMVMPDQSAQPIQLNSDTMENLKQAINHNHASINLESMTNDLRNINAQNILKITARPLMEEDENVTSSAEHGQTNTAPLLEENVTIPADSTEPPMLNEAVDLRTSIEPAGLSSSKTESIQKEPETVDKVSSQTEIPISVEPALTNVVNSLVMPIDKVDFSVERPMDLRLLSKHRSNDKSEIEIETEVENNVTISH